MNTIKNQFQFVICGTDTDIGKTLISSFFVRGLNSFYWKPIQSGIESETDSQAVERLAKVNKAKIINEAYIFREPVSPHWAAEIDQKIINLQLLNLPNVVDSLIVETAGGLMVPITRNHLQIDQIKKWDIPVILVCKSGLGTLNHTLLSIEALKKRNIKILGLIINGKKHLDNPKTLTEFSRVPIIAEFPYIEKPDSNNLDILWEELDIKNKLLALLNSKKDK
tara:strand:- start:659 stop:1327 length:669 start_codon:yes stop_codon:yes gene_type:complete